MRKWLSSGLLVLALALLMSTAALADEVEGIINVTINATASSDITAEVDSTNHDILNLSYKNPAAGSEYVVFVTKTDATPTQNNLVYIDQLTGGKGFKVYPMDLTSGDTYYIWVSSNASGGVGSGGVTQIGTFGYYAAYKLGDVNEDGSVNVSDAAAIVNHVVGRSALTGNKLKAADTNSDGTVNVSDAAEIVNFVVGRAQYLK